MPENTRARNGKGIPPLAAGLQIETEHKAGITWPAGTFTNRIAHHFHDRIS